MADKDKFGGIAIDEPQTDKFGGIPVEEGGKKDEKPKPKGDSLARTGRAWWESVAEPFMNIAGAVSGDPARIVKAGETVIGMAQGIAAEPQRIWEESGRAGQAMLRGDIPRTAYHMAGMVPIVGAPAQQVAQEVEKGDIPEAVGHGLGLYTPAALEAASARLGPIVKKVTNPVLERSLQYLEQPSTTTSTGAVVPRTPVPMSTGQRSGQRALQRTEQVTLPNLPGSAVRAHEAQAATEQALTQRGSELAGAAARVQTDAVGAGKGFLGPQGRLQQRITRLKGRADALYDSVRKDAAANQQTVQVSTQTSPVLGPSGQPIQTPVMQTFETPVNLAPIRSGLRYVYDELNRSLTDAQKQYSPAWASLKDLMKTDKTVMNALDFDKSLSALKAITRDGNSTVLNSQARRLAKQMITEGEVEFQKAMQGAGPNTLAKLKQARDAVRSYHQTADLLAQLPEEPGQLYSYLTKGGDKALNTLEELRKIAPEEMRTVGRTYLEEMIKKATAKGGFDRAAGIAENWRTMGPRTKELLYGKDLVNEINQFVTGSEHLTKPLNPSGSAHGIVASMGGIGVAFEVAKELMQGNYLKAAGWVGGSVVLPNLAARLFLSPGGREWLMSAHQLPLRGAARTMALGNLAGILTQEAKKERTAEPGTVPPLPPSRQ